MLTEEFIRPYLAAHPPTHLYYEESTEIARKLQIHSKGECPTWLLESFRPNEDKKYLDYREKVFTPVTKTYFSKSVATAKKIGRAEDWTIKFEKESEFKNYVTKQYPYFKSVTDWGFSICFDRMMDDPNAVVAVLPLKKLDANNDTERWRPFSFIFTSEEVIDFSEDVFACLLSPEKSVVTVRGEEVQDGRILIFLDIDSYVYAEQYGEQSKNLFNLSDPIMHNCGICPAFKIGGIIEEFKAGNFLYDSFMGDVLPFWDEAVRRYSDHQVNMAIHLHPMEWEMADTPCKTCKNGEIEYVSGGKTHKKTCPTCSGKGMVSTKTPFGVKVIKPAVRDSADNSVSIPTPPAGFIERDIASISFLKTECRDNIKDGFAAINQEFLMTEPEINSGVAKITDRQESNTYFYNVGLRFVAVLNNVYTLIAGWAYSDMKDILPSINVPTKFDAIYPQLLADRLVSAETAKLGPVIKSALEIQYAKAEFGDDSMEAVIIKTSEMLDPLPNRSEDEKTSILASKGTTLKNYIISSNLESFMVRAFNENDGFFELPYASQVDMIGKYADEIMSDNEAKVIPLYPNPISAANGPAASI